MNDIAKFALILEYAKGKPNFYDITYSHNGTDVCRVLALGVVHAVERAKSLFYSSCETFKFGAPGIKAKLVPEDDLPTRLEKLLEKERRCLEGPHSRDHLVHEYRHIVQRSL